MEKDYQTFEGIKELGWNVFYAEVVDERGAYATARNERLKGLREWVTWNNNPYDEQWKSSKTPEDRRGRHYEFGNEAADEFKTPERNMWPQWAVTSGLLDMYLMRHVKKVEAKAMPKKVDPVFAAGSQEKPFVHEFLRANEMLWMICPKSTTEATWENRVFEVSLFYLEVHFDEHM